MIEVMARHATVVCRALGEVVTMVGRKDPWTAADVGMAVLKTLPGVLLVPVGVSMLKTGPETYLWDTSADANLMMAPATLLVGAVAILLASVLTIAASVLRLGGWLIGLGIAVVVVGAFGLGLLFDPVTGALIVPGLVLMIFGMKRSWDAQRSDEATPVEANEATPSS